MIREVINELVVGHNLANEDVELAMNAILNGEATEAEIAAFVVGLRMKGETTSEIATAARVMREHSASIEPAVEGPLLDTCGTGGDALNTFNISTASGIVAASCGVAVAKHGNRAVSSKAGSADVLEALGLRIDLSAGQVRQCIEQVGIGFLFAPSHHAAMRHAAQVRKQLGIRTIFNLLGPLSNPASATHQLVGVYDEARVSQLAEALGQLGLRRAWVVHGVGGMDEISPIGRTIVSEWTGSEVKSFELGTKDFGLGPVRVEELEGGDAQANAEILRRVFEGEQGSPRTAVLVSAAGALCVADAASSPAEGVRLAADAIDSGATRAKLEEWIGFTQGL